MRKLLSLLLLSLIVVAGCGGEDKKTVPVEDVIAAAEQTRAAPSERMEMKIEQDFPQVGKVTMTAEGVYHNKRREGQMTMDMSELVKLSGGEIAPEDARMEILMKDLVFWMKAPFLSKQIGQEDKPWIEFNLDDLGKEEGIDFDALMSGAGQDPTAQLDQLRASSGDVELVGHEDVRGVETTHFRTKVNLRDYVGLVDENKREAARKSIDRVIKLTGSDTIDMDVWIAQNDGRVSRVGTEQELDVPGVGKTRQRQTIDYFDFGVKVDPVEPPPADQTVSLADLVQKEKAGATP